MTVQSSFTSWQTDPLEPDPERCAPICQTWSRYLCDTWGGENLGCYARRPVVGGTSISSHGSGAATDWRYQNPGPGRQVLLDAVLPWLIGWSLELGVQSIHDYVGDRIWRPPGCSGRPAAPSPECGWKTQHGSGGQMGQAWATWIHIECHPSRWGDTRTVDQMLEHTEQEGDDMAMYVAAHPDNDKAGATKQWSIGDQIRRDDYTDPADVTLNIDDANRAGRPLVDLATGKPVKQLSDVKPAGKWRVRLGVPVK